MHHFDTQHLEAAVTYVAASAIDMRRATGLGTLVWRATASVLEFSGPAENASVIELAARRAGWECARMECGECVKWRMQPGAMDDEEEPEQLVLLAA